MLHCLERSVPELIVLDVSFLIDLMCPPGFAVDSDHVVLNPPVSVAAPYHYAVDARCAGVGHVERLPDAVSGGRGGDEQGRVRPVAVGRRGVGDTVEFDWWEGAVIACHGLPFFFSSRRRHTRFDCDWSSDVCSSD